MWKGRLLFGLSAGFLARSDEECCGADCKPSFSASDSPAPGCTTEQTILHDGLHVTQADTMPLPTIFQHGYQEMFNASCASGFQHQQSNLSVTTVVYDCGGLCPESDYGEAIFTQCCTDCGNRDTSLVTGNPIVAFAHCKGCVRAGATVAETQTAFHSRIHATLHTQVTAWINDGSATGIDRTSHVFGSVHDGAWQTNVTGGEIPSGMFPDSGLAVALTGETNGDRLPLASATATVSGPPERRLQHMFENSYGYNTRCAAAIPGTCHGTFQLKLVDCNDCQGVPILKRACCRDCGCALAQEALTIHGGAGNHVHLQCAGCGCADATTGIEAWAAHYVGNCDPLHARVSARYYVHGDIPITFQSPGDVSTNPAFNLAIAEAIAEIAHTDVPASAVTVTFQQARRLESEESARRLSGVVYANYTIEVPSAASARTAEAHIEAETTDTAQAAINRHLTSHNLPTASAVGAFQSTPLGAAGPPQAVPQAAPLAAPLSAPLSAAPSVQHTAVQQSSAPAQENPSSTTQTSGSWLPALLGIAVALGLAVFAIVCFLNSAESPKKRSKRGMSLSPGPSPRMVSGKSSVQPTTSTVLPMTQLQAPVLQMAQQLAPAQAIRLPQQSMIPVYR